MTLATVTFSGHGISSRHDMVPQSFFAEMTTHKNENSAAGHAVAGLVHGGA
jgi:hypothetical protein